MDNFSRKGLAASSVFEMTRKTVSDARTFGRAYRRPQTSKRCARQRCLPQSYAYAIGSYLAGSLANRGGAPVPSLCGPESVPRASVQTVAPPPKAGGQLYTRQIAHLLWRKRREFSEL